MVAVARGLWGEGEEEEGEGLLIGMGFLFGVMKCPGISDDGTPRWERLRASCKLREKTRQ